MPLISVQIPITCTSVYLQIYAKAFCNNAQNAYRRPAVHYYISQRLLHIENFFGFLLIKLQFQFIN